MPSASVAFDARALTEPVDKAQVRSYAQHHSGRGGSTGSAVRWTGVIIVGVAVGLLAMSLILSMAVGGQAGRGGGGFMPTGQFVLVALTGAAVLVFRRIKAAARAERMFRLDRFARANGMTYQAELAAPGLPGMIFGLGDGRRATDQVRGDHPRFVEFANYEYQTRAGKRKAVHTWGYVAVKLGVPLPHIVLDAVGNNELFGSNLPMAFDRAQRLSLEGDFDRHFTLYCPAGYERDALYLFTPDIMARFVDNAAALDVEIVDDWLFLYAKRDFSTLDPAMWAWLFSVVGALLDKLAQWERWRDDRLAVERADAARSTAVPSPEPAGVDGRPAPGLPFAAPLESLRPPPGVAPPGRRLSHGIKWGPIVIVGLIVLVWLMQFAGGFFTTLLR
ncbi:hypothetical protein [Agromyces larvae]|uniref:DUF3137 domain-containing protein n=1 Tax=Agromyces larvae TaxID=2929802 RepID=A0ABY4BVN6_9MICO|nr:hypothetical protein [Agromyces larvae]UOE43287.1 hypothetical protein MTO99_13990 [Agromyces larvae]